MSDSDDAGDPWEDRKRMRADLLYKANRLSDLFVVKGQLPREFKAQQGRLLDRVLDALALSISRADHLTLDRLAAATSVPTADATSATADAPATRRGIPGEPRPAAVQLLDSLKAVQAERDQLLLGKQAGEKAIVDLTRRLEDAERRAARTPAVSSTDAIAKVDAHRERVVGLEKEVDLLKEECASLKEEAEQAAATLAQFAELGSLEEFAALKAIGTPSEIEGRELQLAALVQALVAEVAVCVRRLHEYQAALGPVVLGYDMRTSQLEAVYRAIANLAPVAPDRPIAIPLAAIMPSLGSLALADATSSTALARLVQRAEQPPEEGEVTGASSASMFRVGDSQLLATAREVLARNPLATSTTRSALVEALAPAPNANLYQELVASRYAQVTGSTAAGTSVASSTGRRVDDEQPPAENGLTPSMPSAIDLTTSDASAAESPARPTRRKSAHQPSRVTRVAAPKKGRKKSAVSSGKQKSLNNVDFEKLREVAEEKFRQLAKKEHDKPWPQHPPRAFHFPDSIRQLRMVAWQLKFHLHEVKTPMPNEYRTMVAGGRYTTVEEAVALYRAEPWTILEKPPNPVTFDPTDDRFADFYNATCTLYRQKARAFWERANFLIIEPVKKPSSKSSAGDSERYEQRSQLTSHRRKVNSDFTQPWSAHLHRIRALFNEGLVDADFLMDPFLYWAPAFGVVPLVPPKGRALLSYLDRLWQEDPSRLYFRPPKGAPTNYKPLVAHPGDQHRDRLLMKFTDPARPFTPPREQKVRMDACARASATERELAGPPVSARTPHPPGRLESKAKRAPIVSESASDDGAAGRLVGSQSNEPRESSSGAEDDHEDDEDGDDLDELARRFEGDTEELDEDEEDEESDDYSNGQVDDSSEDEGGAASARAPQLAHGKRGVTSTGKPSFVDQPPPPGKKPRLAGSATVTNPSTKPSMSSKASKSSRG